MKRYRPRNIFPTKTIAEKTLLPNKWVTCFPDSKWEDDNCNELEVIFKGEVMHIKKTDLPCFKTGPYEDKFKRGKKYFLVYYYWEPDVQKLF